MNEEGPIHRGSDREVTETVALTPQSLPLAYSQLALYAGWTMASLYTTSPVPTADGRPELPTVHDLAASARRDLELNRMRHLLRLLGAMPEFAGSALLTDVDAIEADFRARIEELNLEILTALATGGPNIEVAYELGRSLRNTVNPPQDTDRTQSRADALARQLARARIVKLQEWLTSLAMEFPAHTAAVVATSIGRWSEFAAVTVSTTKPRLNGKSRDEVATAMYRYLLPQGDLWLMYLIGARSTSGLLTSEGYVAAVDCALHRRSRVLRQLLRHYWVAVTLVAAVTIGMLYLIGANLGGAAKVWTSIATIGGSVGISAKTIGSLINRAAASPAHMMATLAAEMERPVFTVAEEDAMAWAITTLPPVQLTPGGVRQLRRAGIAPAAGLGRI